MTWTAVLAVAAGGATGAVLRYALMMVAGSTLLFPWATLGINIAGSFCIGAVWGWFAETNWFQAWGQPLLVTGMLGGFTTFSAFSIETINLFHDKGLVLAGVYAGLSVAGCISAAALALRLFSS